MSVDYSLLPPLLTISGLSIDIVGFLILGADLYSVANTSRVNENARQRYDVLSAQEHDVMRLIDVEILERRKSAEQALRDFSSQWKPPSELADAKKRLYEEQKKPQIKPAGKSDEDWMQDLGKMNMAHMSASDGIEDKIRKQRDLDRKAEEARLNGPIQAYRKFAQGPPTRNLTRLKREFNEAVRSVPTTSFWRTSLGIGLVTFGFAAQILAVCLQM